MENEGVNHDFVDYSLEVLEKDGVSMTVMPDAITYLSG